LDLNEDMPRWQWHTVFSLALLLEGRHWWCILYITFLSCAYMNELKRFDKLKLVCGPCNNRSLLCSWGCCDFIYIDRSMFVVCVCADCTVVVWLCQSSMAVLCMRVSLYRFVSPLDFCCNNILFQVLWRHVFTVGSRTGILFTNMLSKKNTTNSLLHKNLTETFVKWPPRRLGRLPALVIHDRAADPATVSVNA